MIRLTVLSFGFRVPGSGLRNSLRSSCLCGKGDVSLSWLCWLLLATLSCGCASPKVLHEPQPFVFHRDTFAFTNETVWEYHIDPATGKTTHAQRQPRPSYSLHCYVLARSARQFFLHARFDVTQPVANEATYRRLIRRVVSLSPRRESPEKATITIPGYANLYAFSEAQAALLKTECGGAQQCYLQRGNWRMIFPFTRRHQEHMAERLLEAVRQNAAPVVHAVRFPRLSINHAMVLFAAQQTKTEIQFTAYDPNSPSKPTPLIFNRAQRRFILPPTHYFAGGRVDVYQIYCGWDY